MIMAEYCPHHYTCPFYQNWVEQTKDKRVDVIVKESEKYDCLTLIALDDFETGIQMTEELSKKLSALTLSRFDCSHLTILNSLKNLRGLN